VAGEASENGGYVQAEEALAMFEKAQFPDRYRHIEVVWLYRKAKDGACLICGGRASYVIVDEDGVEFARCRSCFQQLLEFKRILLVEEGYWIHVLSAEFQGLRRNPNPSAGAPTAEAQANPVENSVLNLKCEICGCRFLSKSDLESHVEAWHKPGGAYYGAEW